MKKHGLLVVVDGPSATGKDTIINLLIKDLEKLSIKVICLEETKEKNYDRRKILAARKKGDKETAKTITSERKKLYQEKVKPRLAGNTVVIANRGEPTTLGYQTLKNQLSMADVWNMHRLADIPLPDFVVITNCSAEEAARRELLRQSKEEKDKKFMSGKFTQSDLEKRKQIHANYRKVKDFLEMKGVPLIYLDTDIMDIAQESKRIVDFIKRYD